LLLGSLFQTFLDIVIDPVALQGRRWFLGQIYGYRDAGTHYGVPLSNYLGWWLVSALMILALQVVDRLVLSKEKPAGVASPPFASIYAPFLYLCVLAFNLAVTVYIGEGLMALTGFFTFALPVAMTLILLANKVNRYRKDDLASHLSDYPWSPAATPQRGANG
jgi:putative membrane protein